MALKRPFSYLCMKFMTERNGPCTASACLISSESFVTTGAATRSITARPTASIQALSLGGQGWQCLPSPVPTACHCPRPWQVGDSRSSPEQHSSHDVPALPGQHLLPTTSKQQRPIPVHIPGRSGASGHCAQPEGGDTVKQSSCPTPLISFLSKPSKLPIAPGGGHVAKNRTLPGHAPTETQRRSSGIMAYLFPRLNVGDTQ